MRTVPGVIVAIAGILAAAGVLRAREQGAPLPEPTERLMYLRSGETAERLFLAFDAVAADVYWIRAMQHYGRDRRDPDRAGRFEMLVPLLDMATTLDPMFTAAYRGGAILLASDPPGGPGATHEAVALLEKGLRATPDRWQYALDIGFIYYWHQGDHLRAAEWFERAADLPDAPAWIPQVAAVTRVEGGDRAGARRLLEGVIESGDPALRASATRSLAQLDALDAIDELHRVVERYTRTKGTRPSSWSDLMATGHLQGIPVDPTGVPFHLLPDTGRVVIGPGSTLLPLPAGLRDE
jgi:FimV-like protein